MRFDSAQWGQFLYKHRHHGSLNSGAVMLRTPRARSRHSGRTDIDGSWWTMNSLSSPQRLQGSALNGVMAGGQPLVDRRPLGAVALLKFGNVKSAVSQSTEILRPQPFQPFKLTGSAMFGPLNANAG